MFCIEIDYNHCVLVCLFAATQSMDAPLMQQLLQNLATQNTGMTATPQIQTPGSTPASPDHQLMQMLMARAVSVPLAELLFQSVMGNQQPPAQTADQSTPLPAAPELSLLLSLLAHATSAAPSQLNGAAAAPLHVTVPPAASPHLPSPSTTNIHLPQVEPSVAKELIIQLVQQLQQAGHLSCDAVDTIRHLLQANAADMAEVEVKEEAVQQVPLCVTANTEGFDEKPAQPSIYVDNALDNSSGFAPSVHHEGETVSQRSESSLPVAAEGKQCKESSSHASSSSMAVNDPNLQKQCLVKLDKVHVDTAQKSAMLAQPSQPTRLSYVDRFKQIKKQCVSTDISQSSTSAESRQSTAATTATASSKKLADCRTGPGPEWEKVPVNLQPAASSTTAGTRNIFSIFAEHLNPSGLQQEEPVAEVRPSDPLPPSVGVLLQRSVNSAVNSVVSLHSMYLGYESHNMEWLSLISGRFHGSRKTYCQCTFCTKLGELPHDMAVHISREHPDLLFALNKLKPVVGPMVCIKCCHCNFVTVDSTLAWIHFDVHHGMSDILDCSDHAADVDLSGPDTPEQFISIDDVMGTRTAYVCFDCSAVSAEPDINASMLLMVRHVVCQHPDSINYNGNFVKLMMLQRRERDADSIHGALTYRQAITEAHHVHIRREVYICMFCRYPLYHALSNLAKMLIVTIF